MEHGLGPWDPARTRCHALRAAVPADGDTTALAERFSTVGARLWREDRPAPSTGAAAARRRAVELARPAESLRAVLLGWSDAADLIVVAPRHQYGRGTLEWLAAGGPAPADTPRYEPTAAAAEGPDWGLGGGPRRSAGFRTALVEPGDETSWLTALAVTLHRYDPAADGSIATARGTLRVPPRGTLGAARPVAGTGPAVAGLFYDDTPGAGAYLPWQDAPFPLSLCVHRERTGWWLRCDHWTDRVGEKIAEQFVRHLRHVHRQVLRAPEIPVADAELLDAREQARVVALGRPAVAPAAAPPTTLHTAFRAVAATRPDACAVSDGRTRLTYRELDERSDRMAAGLHALGVRRGDRVGVCLDRTAELVVTLLAVLKAGAAYVPADPAHPTERLAHIARDAALRLVVTDTASLAGLPDVVPVGPAGLVAEHAGPSPSGRDGDGGAGADDPAYVIYTSGSTGRPKGVVVPHRNPVALVDATRDGFALGPDDVWTLFHSSAFDFSVWEIWGALLTGGRLVVVPYDVSRDPDRFRDLLVAERVSVLSQTPSAFAQLLRVDHTEVTPRLVVFGGEPLDTRMLLPWFDSHPEDACRMVNMYGITETTVHVTAQPLGRGSALAAGRSVGRALPGWHVYVLDPRGRLLPPGVPGEICVGGAGVALGYLGQEELTDQRFRPDPYASGRAYLSGDLGRLRPDGSLDHLGRLDGQVKVRGYRIEPEEIRSVLLDDPTVEAAAVTVRRADPADAATARIDAYVVRPAGPAAGTTTEVRARAARFLPDYMVPATVTDLDALPLTPNGKLDTSALPEPVLGAPRRSGPAAGEQHGSASPRGTEALATTLTQVWSEVLGVPVGLDDDFFELGGNSLYAIRIGTAMRSAGLPALRLRDLYRRPTVRAVLTALTPGTAQGPGTDQT